MTTVVVGYRCVNSNFFLLYYNVTSNASASRRCFLFSGIFLITLFVHTDFKHVLYFEAINLKVYSTGLAFGVSQKCFRFRRSNSSERRNLGIKKDIARVENFSHDPVFGEDFTFFIVDTRKQFASIDFWFCF